MRSDRERLSDVLEAIERVARYAARGRAAFEQDELIQTWIIHHLQVIGEACRSVSEEMKEEHPEVPWNKIMGMRNILVHHYFGLDVDAVWVVVERDLPDLKRRIEALVKRPDKGADAAGAE